MRDHRRVLDDIVEALEAERTAQVPGLVPFKFLERQGDSVVLQRRNGNKTLVRLSTLSKAIDAVRGDHSVYIGGPGRLREFGITHINSPTYALIRVLPLNKLID